MGRTLGEIAVRYGCVLHGDPDLQVHRVGTLEGTSEAIGFAASAAFRAALRQTKLTAVVVPEALRADCPVAALVHPNAHATFARIAQWLHPARVSTGERHPSAVIHSSAQVHPSAQIGPLACIEADAVIAAGCIVGPQCFVGRGAQLGEGTRLQARVTVEAGVVLGQRVIVHPGAVLGSDGFGNARDGAAWVKVPQLGGVRIGDDVEIGANTTIDRGALNDTVIETGARLDNQIQIAHNVHIGAHTAIAACVGIAGSTRIGARCMIGGGAGVGGQLTIVDDVVITGFGQVSTSIPKPGLYSSVWPAEEARVWRRLVGRVKRLSTLEDRLRKLETLTGVSSAAATDGESDD